MELELHQLDRAHAEFNQRLAESERLLRSLEVQRVETRTPTVRSWMKS